MPIKILPNGQWIDTDTGQVVAPGTPQTSAAPAPTPAPAQTAPTTAPATPATPTALNPYGTAGEPSVNGNTSTAPAQVSNPASTSPTTAQSVVPDITKQDTAYQAVVQQSRDDLKQARDDVLGIQKQIDDTNKQIGALAGGANNPAFPALQSTLNTLYSSQSNANLKVGQLSETFATVATKAIDSAQLTGVTADKAKAEADAATANAQQSRAQADALTKGSPSQIELASQQAALAAANANAQIAKTPEEVNQLKAQAASLDAQAKLTSQKVETEKAQGKLTDAQATIAESNAATSARASEAATSVLESQAIEEKNKAQGLPTLDQQQAVNQAAVAQAQANVGQTQSVTASNTATAAATNAGVQQKLLGPAYGLQDQIDAIRKIQQQVFGPGGTGDPSHADDLLNQFFTATVGGTTIGDAAKAAAQQQGVNYATQMTGTDTLQSAMASRANQFAQLGGTALGQLGQMNEYAPKGSTAGAAAYRQVMDEMASRLAQPQFAPVQLPQAPGLPPFLQAFAAGHQAGQQQAAAQQQPQGGQGQPININIGGQPAGGSGPYGSTPLPYAGGPTPPMQPMPNVGGQTPPMVPMGAPAMGTPGYAAPPPIPTAPALGPQTTPQQSFMNGVQGGMGALPSFAQNYGIRTPSPMGMIGFQGGF